MLYRVQREADGAVLKVHCPECKLTAWLQAESRAFHGEAPLERGDVDFYMVSARDGLAERLRNAGCEHPMDPDAEEQLAKEVYRLFGQP